MFSRIQETVCVCVWGARDGTQEPHMQGKTSTAESHP